MRNSAVSARSICCNRAADRTTCCASSSAAVSGWRNGAGASWRLAPPDCARAHARTAAIPAVRPRTSCGRSFGRATASRVTGDDSASPAAAPTRWPGSWSWAALGQCRRGARSSGSSSVPDGPRIRPPHPRTSAAAPCTPVRGRTDRETCRRATLSARATCVRRLARWASSPSTPSTSPAAARPPSSAPTRAPRASAVISPGARGPAWGCR